MSYLDKILAMFDDWFSWLMEMRFWKMNSIRLRGLKVLIIMIHEKFPTFAFGTRMYFFPLDF
jgi:hypothetical protein